jgi:hypothetical protein
MRVFWDIAKSNPVDNPTFQRCIQPASSTLMMEAVRTSETSVYSNETTWRYIPEDSHFHTRRRKNLKSHFRKMS